MDVGGTARVWLLGGTASAPWSGITVGCVWGDQRRWCGNGPAPERRASTPACCGHTLTSLGLGSRCIKWGCAFAWRHQVGVQIKPDHGGRLQTWPPPPPPSPPCPQHHALCDSASRPDAGLGHKTCFDPTNIIKCEVSEGLQSACVSRLARSLWRLEPAAMGPRLGRPAAGQPGGVLAEAPLDQPAAG